MRGSVALAGRLLASAVSLCGCGSPDGGAMPPDASDAPADAPDAGPVPPGMPDLQLIPADMIGTLVLTDRSFDAGACEIEEQCVGGPGMRKLLRFATVTANLGTDDLRIGTPPGPEQEDQIFEWSSCHMHHHFIGYSRYELISATGETITARKQSFCIEDRVPLRPAAPHRFSCADQGLSRNWSDSYNRDTACQWIDITGLGPGLYTLRITVNPDGKLTESNYDNNVFTVEVRL